MKAIQTKFIPCTNTKPARYKAWDGDGNTAIVSGLKAADNGGLEAAKALVLKMGWAPCSLSEGWTKDGAVFVIDAVPYVVPRPPQFRVSKAELWGNVKDGFDWNCAHAIGKTIDEPVAYMRSIFATRLPLTESGAREHVCKGKCLQVEWSDYQSYGDIVCSKYGVAVGSIELIKEA